MKFLKHEYDSIKEIINKAGLEYSKFSFVKKRGMLNINFEDRADSFCFFRKKETILNDQMKFEDKITYFVGPKKEHKLSNWDDVLGKFQNWLD